MADPDLADDLRAWQQWHKPGREPEMRYAAKTDTTHAEIRDALRQLGWHVIDTSKCGGFVDLVVRRGESVYLIECKTPLSKAGRVEKTPGQQKLEDAGWTIHYLASVEQALDWARERR
jgi:hypothetical protein